MASRTNVTAGIFIAQLDGRARYHLQHRTPQDTTLAELRTIGAPPALIREAADSARAAYLADPIRNWQSADIADLLDNIL